MVSRTRRILIYHPFLFACYAVLGMYARNSQQVPVQWVIRPLLILLILVSLIYSLLRRKTSEAQYAAFVVTLAIFWFFLGHFQRMLYERSELWGTFYGICIAFMIWTVPLVLLGSPWAWRQIRNPHLVTSSLNLTSMFVLLIPVFVTGGSVIQTILHRPLYRAVSAMGSPVHIEAQQTQPDIYLIIVDGYGREDFLQEGYGYDNTRFVDYLKESGFYLADESTANYPQTLLSLSSMLNFQYLNEYVEPLKDRDDRTVLYELVQHSSLRRLLDSQGYTFIALPSPSLATQIRDADIYFSLKSFDINEFEDSLLSATVLGVGAEAAGAELSVMGYELHRDSIDFALAKLQDIPQIPGPKFIFAHIMLPHPPFVFDRDGNAISPARPYTMLDGSLCPGTVQEYKQGYTDQVTFLNRRLITIVGAILEQSENPPIIILQGDHGAGAFFNFVELDKSCLCERFAILNAYYFPDQDYRSLYSSITPVNSFRVILNQYFGADLDMLEDRSYYASWSAPYRFIDVTGELDRPCLVPGTEMH